MAGVVLRPALPHVRSASNVILRVGVHPYRIRVYLPIQNRAYHNNFHSGTSMPVSTVQPGTGYGVERLGLECMEIRIRKVGSKFEIHIGLV